MRAFATAWASAVCVWALAGAELYGIGCLVARAIARGEPVPRLVRFWLGWAAALALLQIWHFALPVDARVHALLGTVAAAGLTLELPAFRATLRKKRGHPLISAGIGGCPLLPAAGAALVAVLVAVAAALALRAPMNPDTCLYYVATIRWFERYALVPGLGNLHHRLAFNHAYYLYAALFELGPARGNGEHLANGLLLLGVLAPASFELVRIADRSGPQRNSSFATVAIAGVLLDFVFSSNLPSPSADVAVAATSAVILLVALAPALDGAELTPFRLRATAILCVAAVVAKLSAVIVAGPILGYAALEALRARHSRAEWRRAAITTAVALALLVAPWLARGELLSGYPLFPLEIFDLRLPWRIPEGVGASELAYERAFARLSATPDPPPGSPWVGHWLSLEWVENREFLIPVAILVASACAAIWLALRYRRRVPGARAWLATLVALALWWVLAPHPRFAVPLLWTSAIAGALLALDLAAATTAKLALSLAVVAGALTTVGSVRVSFARGFDPAGPEKVVDGRFGSGEPTHVYAGCCLDPPCVRGDPSLIFLRRPGDLASGFCVESGCAAESQNMNRRKDTFSRMPTPSRSASTLEPP